MVVLARQWQTKENATLVLTGFPPLLLLCPKPFFTAAHFIVHGCKTRLFEAHQCAGITQLTPVDVWDGDLPKRHDVACPAAVKSNAY